MEFLNLCPEQLEKQHICCAMSNRPATAAKKAWLKQRLAEGLVFRRLDVNGKVFIEYLPAEAAWCPIQDVYKRQLLNIVSPSFLFYNRTYSTINVNV